SRGERDTGRIGGLLCLLVLVKSEFFQHFAALRRTRGSFCSAKPEGSNPIQDKTSPKRTRFVLAEREGFEPSVPSLARRFSRPFPSTARAPLLARLFYHLSLLFTIFLERLACSGGRPYCGRASQPQGFG